MKNIFFILSIIIFTSSCCEDDFTTAAGVGVTILKDNMPLKTFGIEPTFYFVASENEEVKLPLNIFGDTNYSIKSSHLRMISFKPSTILIRYNGLPENTTDTLEVLHDYDCEKTHQCDCKVVLMKYMKCNSVLLDDFTIRK